MLFVEQCDAHRRGLMVRLFILTEQCAFGVGTHDGGQIWSTNETQQPILPKIPALTRTDVRNVSKLAKFLQSGLLAQRINWRYSPIGEEWKKPVIVWRNNLKPFNIICKPLAVFLVGPEHSLTGSPAFVDPERQNISVTALPAEIFPLKTLNLRQVHSRLGNKDCLLGFHPQVRHSHSPLMNRNGFAGLHWLKEVVPSMMLAA